jgi:hypothetical protein
MARAPARQAGTSFDRIAATLAALVVVGLAVFLLVRNEPIASPQLFFVVRVVLSFAVAVLGATIPGFLEIGWKGSGLAIRAGGALALFVLTFVYTPDLVPGQTGGGQTTISAPGGVAAGQIDRSPIIVNPPAAPGDPPMSAWPAPCRGAPAGPAGSHAPRRCRRKRRIEAPGGVAAGRIENSPITIGLPPAEQIRLVEVFSQQIAVSAEARARAEAAGGGAWCAARLHAGGGDRLLPHRRRKRRTARADPAQAGRDRGTAPGIDGTMVGARRRGPGHGRVGPAVAGGDRCGSL